MDGMRYACRLETGYFSTREMGVFQRNYNLKNTPARGCGYRSCHLENLELAKYQMTNNI